MCPLTHRPRNREATYADGNVFLKFTFMDVDTLDTASTTCKSFNNVEMEEFSSLMSIVNDAPLSSSIPDTGESGLGIKRDPFLVSRS
ncbi:hypothetical protein LguiA_027268 [Lonicera macranthoides]